MIYLNCEVKSGLGEDTFWTWFNREFPLSTFEEPHKVTEEDIILRYSTLGILPIIGKQVALCWELYPQMKKLFNTEMWNSRIEKVYETARYATYRTVATQASVEDYTQFGSVDVIPIGVDTTVFKPLKEKSILRKKYGIPLNKDVGVWIGTGHPMKGYADFLQYVGKHSSNFWICIWKWKFEALPVQADNILNFIQIPQSQIAELINSADFFCCTNRLKSYYMSEWEAMSCNIPFQYIGNYEKEFFIKNEDSRDVVYKMGWDRFSVKKQWEFFFTERGVVWQK